MENLRTLWDEAATNSFHLPAVQWLEKKNVFSATYGNLNKLVKSIRVGLAAQNINHAHIALIGESSFQWIASYLAIVTGQNVAVPLDALLPESDLIDLIDRSDSEVLFLSPKLISLAEPVLKSCTKIRQIWLLQDSYNQRIPNGKIGTLPELVDLSKNKPDINGASPDSLSTIIFTSGTTGKSRVSCSLRKICMTM